MRRKIEAESGRLIALADKEKPIRFPGKPGKALLTVPIIQVGEQCSLSLPE